MRDQHALVTGGAGFIGSHLVDALLAEGWRVTVVDNFDPFYAAAIKEDNVAPHRRHPSYCLARIDFTDPVAVDAELRDNYDVIVHLGARAGVRPSLADPPGYQHVNVTGTQCLLEFARRRGIAQFVFASSSSVYGVNPHVPWHEEETRLQPISPYASTKISGELLGHVYSHLYGLRFVALRFFTVYGPRQRPDLAIHKFARAMLAGEVIPFYGDGTTRRDYTCVADTVRGIRAAMEWQGAPFSVFNLGNDRTVSLQELIDTLEAALGVRARLTRLPDQPGDVPQTWASIDKARRELAYAPQVSFEEGIKRFVSWLEGTEGTETGTHGGAEKRSSLRLVS
ncbi:MAG: NAD-dependent epimerase/dehydratase family protein [Vicinamibacterales bacterium]